MTGWLKYQHSDRWHRVRVVACPGYEAYHGDTRVTFGPRDVLVVVTPQGGA